MIVFIFKESCSLLFYCTIIYFCYVSVNEVIVWTVNFILFLLEWKTFIMLFELKTEKWSKNAPFKHELLIILAQCKFCSFAKKLLLNLSTQHAGSHIYSTFCLYFWLWWKHSQKYVNLCWTKLRQLHSCVQHWLQCSVFIL